MSAEILKNGKEILKCSSIFFNVIYLKFLNLFHSQPMLNTNLELHHFMQDMEIYNNNGGSYWFDITNYIKSKEGVDLLIKMTKTAKSDSYLSSTTEAYEILEKFYKELLIYKKELL